MKSNNDLFKVCQRQVNMLGFSEKTSFDLTLADSFRTSQINQVKLRDEISFRIMMLSFQGDGENGMRARRGLIERS